MHSFWRRDQIIQIVIILVLLILTPLVLFLVQTSQENRSKAAESSANIVIETNTIVGPLSRPWEALAQGGEGKGRMLEATIFDVRQLKPRYIRIDHIFDQYDIVSKDANGIIQYNFTLLDQTVDDILASGALPLLSLSYMPTELATDSIISAPKSWGDWQLLVQKTIEHYSGQFGKNLINVYYEVWNEPDIFGNYSQYHTLYKYAVMGANNAENTNPFKIGGPVTSVLERPNVLGKVSYVDLFLRFVKNEHLRLDFISWHLYSFKPSEYFSQVEKVNLSLASYPEFLSLPKMITEWGSNSEMDIRHNQLFDAAHTVATIRTLLGRIDLAFSFEIIDGIQSDGTAFSGRWGVLTHDSFGRIKKPRYYALSLLSQLRQQQIKASGENDFIYAISSKDETTISTLLTNYDSRSTHAESVPVTFLGLEKANYTLRKTVLDQAHLSSETTESEIAVTTNQYTITLPMTSNSVVLLELSKVSPIYDFEQGRFGYASDSALLININSRSSHFPVINNIDLSTGTIDVWIKPTWSGNDNKTYTLFEVPLTNQKVFGAYKLTSGFTNTIQFGIWKEGNFPYIPYQNVSINISSWQKDIWQHLSFIYSPNQLGIAVNGVLTKESTYSGIIQPEIGQNFYLGKRADGSSPFMGLFDELRISKTIRTPLLSSNPYVFDLDTITLRHFDNTIDPITQ